MMNMTGWKAKDSNMTPAMITVLFNSIVYFLGGKKREKYVMMEPVYIETMVRIYSGRELEQGNNAHIE